MHVFGRPQNWQEENRKRIDRAMHRSGDRELPDGQRPNTFGMGGREAIIAHVLPRFRVQIAVFV